MPLRRVSLLLLAVLVLAVVFPLAAQSADPFPSLRWRLIGPFRGGRTVAATGVPGQPNVFYMAATNGGAWKTIDYGQTWTPIFDGQNTGSVGALALAPSDPNILYLGSGEGLQRPDLSVGNGIYKSTDAGNTWTHLGLRDAQQIGAVIVDPHDPNRVFVAAVGHPYGPNAERGVFRSTDGGVTWKKVLYKDENTGAIEVAFDPDNPQIIYADLWAARHSPWSAGDSLKAAGSGLFKSTDGGDTWTQLEGGLPTWADGLGRIGFSIAPSDPQRMYAMVDASRRGGVYRSDDAGAHWRLVNTERRIWGRGSDFAEVKVDPHHPDTIYVANTSTYRSTDGGANFTAIKGAPGGDDYHTVWLSPDNPDIILLASDQGVTISVNGGQTWSSWYNQPTAQFYHVITDNQFPYWVYGGQQESGSIGTASRSDYGEITFRDWHPVGVEEYGYVAPDPLHPNLIYGGKTTVYDSTTGQVHDVSPVALRTGKYRFNRTAPLLFSPLDPHVLYLGSNVLFKTVNGGHSWQIISPDLTRPDPGIPPSLGKFADNDPRHGQHRGVIYTIAPSFKDTNLIWVGTDDGLIQVTHDGGRTWKDVTPAGLTPWSKLALMEASHFDTATAYAAVNRLRVDDLQPYIYRTHDGGKSWQKITRGLPDDAPVNAVREDPTRKGLLFCGTERGIYVSFNDGDEWQSLQNNLPATSMRDLVIHGDDLVVGTHGRSFWILDDITPLREFQPQLLTSGAHLFRPELTYRLRRDNNPDTPLPPEVPAGQNPPNGAVLDYYLQTAPVGPVTIEIRDAAGTLVRRFASNDQPPPFDAREVNVPTYWIRPPQVLPATAGWHRFVWDLHQPAPDSVVHDYPISAIPHDTPRIPQGAAVLPGRYSVTLTADGKRYSQPLVIKMDPRVKTPVAGLVEQFRLERRITAAMDRDYRALQAVKQLQAETGRRAAHATSATAAALATLSRALGGLVGGGYGEGSPTGLAGLNVALGTVLGEMAGADATPTVAVTATTAELESNLAAVLAQWRKIQAGELNAANRAVQAAGLPALTAAN